MLRRLEQALGAARWLESVAELEFVVGPIPDRSGTICRLVAENLALSLYPWLDTQPMRQPDDARTAELLVRLHGVMQCMPPGIVRTEDFVIPGRVHLEGALADLETVWTTGPYAELARELLRRHLDGIHSLLAFYDGAAGQARNSRPGWVVTHGEPFGPNLLQSAPDRLHLVDWDSILVAPRERDLWDLPRIGPTWATYHRLVDAPLDDQLLQLYRAWYDLAETATYTCVFRSPHRGAQNDQQSWDNFLVFLPTDARWPDVVA